MTIGDRIKAKRETLGMSAVKLSDLVGISKQTLYKYENNIVTNMPLDRVEQFAKVLNCTPGYLMGWDDDKSELLSELENALKLLPEDQLERILAYAKAFHDMYSDNQ